MSPKTIKDIREGAYKEMFSFIDWLAKKHPLWWEAIMGEYYEFKNK